MERSTRFSALEATLSPARRLPPEIVAEVFLLACPAALPLPPCGYIPQLVVSQICSGWRRVALELKQLWQCAVLRPTIANGAFVEESEADILLANIWLSRASPLPRLSRPHGHRFQHHPYTSCQTMPKHRITRIKSSTPSIPRITIGLI